MLLVEATAPLLRATIIAVLRKPRQPVSCVLSFKNVPSLTKAVKQSNGHPNMCSCEVLLGELFILQNASRGSGQGAWYEVSINQGYRYLGGRKKLTLITELCSAYMEPLCHVSRGKTGEGDTGKRDYRYHNSILREKREPFKVGSCIWGLQKHLCTTQISNLYGRLSHDGRPLAKEHTHGTAYTR